MVRDDEIRHVLTTSNPWWRATVGGLDPTEWTRDHRLLRERATHDLGYRADVLHDLVAEPITDRLVILTGPRRIGKSVALLDAAAALCARDDVDPRQILHVPCDGMRERDLRRVLALGRELTRSVDRGGSARRVWLFDEVSAVPGWTAVLKVARDQTRFGADTVVATGSRWAAGEDVVANLLSGRAGTDNTRRVRHLLPMSLRDYLAATRPELPRPPAVHPADLQQASVALLLEDLRYDLDEYDLAWQAYLTCGGFPRAVAEHTTTGAVSRSYVHDINAWLRGDVDPEGVVESIALLLAGLTERASSPLSVTRAGEDLGYSTRPVFDRRLARLTSSFAALWSPQRDEHGQVLRGSQSKLYLTDPLLAWLPSTLRAGIRAPDMTVLTEMALGVCLARAIEVLDPGRWVTNDTIGYARTGSGNEVDFASVPVPTTTGTAMTVPVESKWVSQGWRSQARVIEGKYGRGIVATKSILDVENPTWAVPAPVLALLLL